MKLVLVAGALLGVALAAAACSSSDAPAVSAAPPEADAAPVEEAPDAGPVEAGPPRPSAPKVLSAGGPVLKSPAIVVATFGDEPEAAALEKFATDIGATPYWKSVTSEYGVGPATFARSVKIADVPATITQSGIEKWLVGQLDGTHPEWGTPSASNIYSIVFTKQTQVLVDGVACQGSPAWHGEVKLAGSVSVPYAVITRCDPFIGLEGIDYLTAGLSHEWIEASTNPFYSSNPAWNAPANDDAPWATVTFGELGDMCASSTTVYEKPAGFPFTVQRSWSNASAAAGHDPCVPRPTEAYFNSVPMPSEKIQTGGMINAETVHGIAMKVGESRTIDVALFSDAETSGPWTVKATDYAQRMGSPADLKFTWDRTQGKNGDTLHLTITRVKSDSGLGGAALFLINSKLGPRENLWVGAVGDAAH